MSNFKIFYFKAILAFIVMCGQSYAAEPVRFDYEPGNIEKIAFNNFSKTFLNENSIAIVDLNDDGLNEFISKAKTCDKPPGVKNLCDFQVLAYSLDNNEILQLVHFQARAVNLSNNYFKGIRDLHVYNVEENDYDYNILRWNPEKSGYGIIADGL